MIIGEFLLDMVVGKSIMAELRVLKITVVLKNLKVFCHEGEEPRRVRAPVFQIEERRIRP